MIDLNRNPSYTRKYPENSVRPTIASLLVTENCNLACKYCFEVHDSKRKSMTPEVVRQTLNYLFNNARLDMESGQGDPNDYKVGVTFFGGEPTLVPDVLQMFFELGLKMSRDMGIRFTTDMITNTTIMNKKLYDLFSRYKDETDFSVQMSIDGKRETQDQYRVTKGGKGSFSMVEKVVPYYKELFKNRPRALHVHGCLNEFSIGKLYENYLFFREEWGIERTWFIPVQECNWEDRHVEIYKEQMQKIYEYVMADVRKHKRVQEVDWYAPLDRCLKGNRLPKNSKPCGAGTNYCTVTAEGELYPCHQIFYNDPEKQTLIGNIWNGVDDDKRRFFLEYQGADMSCPIECDHGWCYRCVGSNYCTYGSMLTQHVGRYCQMMKIDQFFQNKIKKELEEMGLTEKTNTGSGEKNPGDCKCDVRAYENRVPGCDSHCRIHTPDASSGCDLVSCDQLSRSNVCDLVARDESAKMETIKPKSFEEVGTCCPSPTTGKVFASNFPVGREPVEVWEKDGKLFKKYVNEDGSISVYDQKVTEVGKDLVVENKESSCDCGGGSCCGGGKNEVFDNSKDDLIAVFSNQMETFSLALKTIIEKLITIEKKIK